MEFDMKLFKSLTFSLMALPSVALGMELPGDYVEQLPTVDAESKTFENQWPAAVAADIDLVHFEPIDSQRQIALSADGSQRAVSGSESKKIFINRPSDALESGISLKKSTRTFLGFDSTCEIFGMHWLGKRLALVEEDKIRLFDPETGKEQHFTFDKGYQLVDPDGTHRIASALGGDDELVFGTYIDYCENEFSDTSQYLYRVQFPAVGDPKTLLKRETKRLMFYSVLAASKKYTAVIKNAQPNDDWDTQRAPSIRIFTEKQYGSIAENGKKKLKIVPTIKHKLPQMMVDAALFSPDESSFIVAGLMQYEPTILIGSINSLTLSLVKRLAPSLRVFTMAWPAQAEGPYFSYGYDAENSSQLILAPRTKGNSHETGKSEIGNFNI